MDAMRVYNRLPVALQNLACYVEGKKIVASRYGRQFWKYLSEYEERDLWSYEQRCEFRDKRLRQMVRHCYETVPYYTKCFNDGGVNPEKIKHLDDLSVLPILTKNEVNRQAELFVSVAYSPRRMLICHTSGTTGGGFIFRTTQRAICEQWAVWWRYRRRLGISFDVWCALFGGRSVVPITKKKPPFYRMNRPNKQVYFSAYHMSESNMKYYLEALEKHKLCWIHGYPSSIALLAQYMIDNNVRLSYDVQRVTTGAENLLQQQKDVIIKAFGVCPFQHYGMAEGISNISEDINHSYVIDEDFACTEFLYNSESNTYKIVGTSLTNYAMPLLRYDVGDNARLLDGDRKKILAIDGRREDYLTLASGAKVGRLDHIFKDMVHIREAQIRQDRAGNITFCVVKSAKYNDADEEHLKREIAERIGREAYRIEYVDYIQKSKGGKLRFVVSEKGGPGDVKVQ